jgi:hypothetical protein
MEVFDRINSIKKNEVFNVPEGYFEDFPQRLNSRIEKHDVENSKTLLRLFFSFKFAFPVALAAILVVSYFLFDNYSTNSDIKMLSQQEIFNLYNENHIDFDDELLLAAISDEEAVSSNHSFNEILEYLQDENIDENQIIEQLTKE